MYIVEGNIGAGKSTFLKLLGDALPALTVIFEPLHNWQTTDHGSSLLEQFYTQPQRWAYTIEMLTLLSRTQEHRKRQAAHAPLAIMERSIYSGHYCFGKNSYRS